MDFYKINLKPFGDDVTADNYPALKYLAWCYYSGYGTFPDVESENREYFNKYINSALKKISPVDMVRLPAIDKAIADFSPQKIQDISRGYITRNIPDPTDRYILETILYNL